MSDEMHQCQADGCTSQIPSQYRFCVKHQYNPRSRTEGPSKGKPPRLEGGGPPAGLNSYGRDIPQLTEKQVSELLEMHKQKLLLGPKEARYFKDDRNALIPALYRANAVRIWKLGHGYAWADEWKWAHERILDHLADDPGLGLAQACLKVIRGEYAPASVNSVIDEAVDVPRETDGDKGASDWKYHLERWKEMAYLAGGNRKALDVLSKQASMSQHEQIRQWAAKL